MAEEKRCCTSRPRILPFAPSRLPSSWLEELHLIGRAGQTWGVHIAVLKLRRTTYDMGETDCYQQIAGSSEIT